MDDFEVDAEGGGVLDEVLAVASVDSDLAQGGMVGGGLLQEGAAGGGVLDAGRCDQDCEKQAEGVGDDAALAPTIFLPASMSWLLAGTMVEVFTLCASITPADGATARPSCCRSNSRSRPLSWAKTPSFCHLAK